MSKTYRWTGVGMSSVWNTRIAEPSLGKHYTEVVRPWSVEVYKDWRMGDLWIFHAIAKFTDGLNPPYPGHAVLESWLDDHYKSVVYERTLKDGSSRLEITFNNSEEGLLFKLGTGYGDGPEH
jgi:hypothetical protein